MPVIACTPQTFTPGIVQFSAPEFLASYPEFTGINPASLANDFVGATFLLNNTCFSRVQDANQRLFLLYLITAHLAAIHQGINDAGVGSPAVSFVASVAAGVMDVTAINPGSQIPLAVGLTLYDGPSIGGSLLVPGSSIASLGSGTGGIGTYNITPSQTVISETIIVPGVPLITPPLGIVGRINNASEGDVSVASEWSAPPNANAAYFLQTKYGADYWTMTARYRTALFVPAPARAYNPLIGLGPGPWGGGSGPWGGGGCGC
jgi:hypothetical protein